MVYSHIKKLLTCNMLLVKTIFQQGNLSINRHMLLDSVECMSVLTDTLLTCMKTLITIKWPFYDI